MIKTPRARNIENRPDIATITASAELRRWYWTKDELLGEVRRLGLKQSGGKFTLLDRIAHYLDTGERHWPGDIQTKPKSKFDWHGAPLTPDTLITDNYRNTQNVRRFFKAQIDDSFKFNIAFMNWLRTNAGKTLADAVTEYRRQQAAASEPGFQSDIADHNQFNQYTRDFLADNPELGLKEVRRFWALKRALPSATGRHVYERSDLEL